MKRDDSTCDRGEWIEPRVYFELATSNRRLFRCDVPRDGLCGLFDPESGRRYWVAQENLISAAGPADIEGTA